MATPTQTQTMTRTTKANGKTGLTQISDYMRSEIVKSRFAEILGTREAGPYIGSVLLAVANSDDLQKCTPGSIFKAALQAATLRLSVDTALGQAWLVPFENRKKGVMEAVFVPGWKGLQDLAVRTGKYRYINVGPIFEGETITEDRITGFITLSGNRKSNQVIGWLASFEMNPERGHVTGFAKQVYMTVDEIHKHGKRYARGYSNQKSKWQSDPESMERKTVLRRLLTKWGYLDPSDSAALGSIDDETTGAEVIDVESEPVEVPQLDPGPQRTEAENLKQLGF